MWLKKAQMAFSSVIIVFMPLGISFFMFGCILCNGSSSFWSLATYFIVIDL
jgi:hypothetical protein